ncbi:MAG: hypothetical protein ACK520_13120 [Inhella sp.]|uniref:DinB/UmuC family translesion DNA polymerase n=1 Tax=Inhella sp. TaxID=1921806 RepID=UPI00345B7745
MRLRFAGFRAYTRDQAAPETMNSVADWVHAARLCRRRLQFNARTRLIGVRAGNLVRPG